MTCEVTGLMALGMSAELVKRVGWTCGTVAATGSTIADAATLYNISLVTGADATVGVKLPQCDIGSFCWARNNAAATLKVYGNSASENIYIAATATAQAGSTAIVITAYYNALFIKVANNTWLSMEIVSAV